MEKKICLGLILLLALYSCKFDQNSTNNQYLESTKKFKSTQSNSETEVADESYQIKKKEIYDRDFYHFKPEIRVNSQKNKKPKIKKQTTPTSNYAFVSPSPKHDVPNEIYSINPTINNIITYEKTGSTIEIPANSIVDEKGNLVTENVDITYREFHSQKDVFFSGIPMNFEVNGEESYFETAGMMELQAYKENKKLSLKSGAEIKVNMTTDKNSEDFNLYELNKNTTEWKEIGKPKLTKNEVKSTKYLSITPRYQSINDMEIMINMGDRYEYTKEKKKKYFIEFKVDIRNNNDVGADISNENKKERRKKRQINGLSFRIYDVKWVEFKKILLKYGFEKGKTYEYDNGKKYKSYYTASYINIKKISEEKYNISFKDKDDKELVLHSSLVNKYASKRTKKKRKEALETFDFNTYFGKFRKFANNGKVIGYDSIWVDNSALSAIYLIQNKFTVNGFGVYNCDNPKAFPTEQVASLNYDLKEITSNKLSSIHLVDSKKGASFIYNYSMFEAFWFNPSADNFLYSVIDQNNIAYLLPDDFSKVDYTNKKFYVPFSVASMDEFNEILEKLYPTKLKKDYEVNS